MKKAITAINSAVISGFLFSFASPAVSARAASSDITLKARMTDPPLGAVTTVKYTDLTSADNLGVRTKFTAKLIIVDPNSLKIDKSTKDLEVQIDGKSACAFSGGVLGSVTENGHKVAAVMFAVTISEKTTVTVKGTNHVIQQTGGSCDDKIPVVVKGSTTAIVLNTTPAPTILLTGTLLPPK